LRLALALGWGLLLHWGDGWRYRVRMP